MERTAPIATDALPAWSTALGLNDPAVIRALYQEHFPVIKQYVLQNSGTASDAQDMFQEAVSVLWLSVKEGRIVPDADPGGFLFRVARNKWLDVIRSARFRTMKVMHDERLSDVQNDVGDDVEERLARLRSIYENLDDKCRAVLDRYYFERKDLATIADEMGVGEDSIRTIKYRCMMKLRAFRKTISGDDHFERS